VVVGIAIGSIAAVFIIGGIIWYFFWRRKRRIDNPNEVRDSGRLNADGIKQYSQAASATNPTDDNDVSQEQPVGGRLRYNTD
jgi:hypothetical protein